jgi:hypothetical protein
VHPDNPEDPTARPAHSGDFDYGLVEGFGIELVAFVALGLNAAKQPGFLEVVEGLLGQSPQLFRVGRAFA